MTIDQAKVAALYIAAVSIACLAMTIVASFTVIPMVENYRDHGSIFLDPTP